MYSPPCILYRVYSIVYTRLGLGAGVVISLVEDAWVIAAIQLERRATDTSILDVVVGKSAIGRSIAQSFCS